MCHVCVATGKKTKEEVVAQLDGFIAEGKIPAEARPDMIAQIERAEREPDEVKKEAFISLILGGLVSSLGNGEPVPAEQLN
jgi:hypothetical protein